MACHLNVTQMKNNCLVTFIYIMERRERESGGKYESIRGDFITIDHMEWLYPIRMAFTT
jgi:hypothetical protein